jgi:hypothetical protein
MYKFYFSRYFVSQISFEIKDDDDDQKKDKKYSVEIIDRYDEYDNFIDIDVDFIPAKIHNKPWNQIIVE